MSIVEPQFAQVAFPPLTELPPDPEWPLAVYAQHAILTQFRKLIAQRRVVWDNVDIEGVHDIRVAARRCRTALATFRDLWDEDRARHFNKLLSRFASAFGTARDLDVMILYLEQRLAADPGERSTAYRWLIDRSRARRLREQDDLKLVLGEFETGNSPGEVVDYFSRHPYDLWTWEAADG